MNFCVKTEALTLKASGADCRQAPVLSWAGLAVVSLRSSARWTKAFSSLCAARTGVGLSFASVPWHFVRGFLRGTVQSMVSHGAHFLSGTEHQAAELSNTPPPWPATNVAHRARHVMLLENQGRYSELDFCANLLHKRPSSSIKLIRHGLYVCKSEKLANQPTAALCRKSHGSSRHGTPWEYTASFPAASFFRRPDRKGQGEVQRWKGQRTCAQLLTRASRVCTVFWCLLMSFMHIVCCARPHWPPTCCDSHSICAGVWFYLSYLQWQNPGGSSRVSFCSSFTLLVHIIPYC